MASQSFDCQNLLKALAGTSILCPPVNTQLLDVYFFYFKQNGFIEGNIEITGGV